MPYTTLDYEEPFYTMPSPETAAAAAPSPAMTVGSVLLVCAILLLFAAFAFAFALCQYLATRRRLADAGASPRGGRRLPGGIGPEDLRSLPVTVYRAEDVEGEAPECAVCLAELADGEEVRLLPKCGHRFHVECIDMWLRSHSTCPLCRLAVGVPDASPPPRRPTMPSASPEPANYPPSPPTSILFRVRSLRRLWSSSASACSCAGSASIAVPDDMERGVIATEASSEVTSVH